MCIYNFHKFWEKMKMDEKEKLLGYATKFQGSMYKGILVMTLMFNISFHKTPLPELWGDKALT